jgi:hypothetical protein
MKPSINDEENEASSIKSSIRYIKESIHPEEMAIIKLKTRSKHNIINF